MNVQIGAINGLYYGMEMVALANQESELYSVAYLYQNKTNYYKNPNISKNLYIVSDELKEIKEYYDKNKSSKYKYLDTISNTYLNNYSCQTRSNVKESMILSLYKLIDKNTKA